MEAHAEGLEGRPHRTEVLATFAGPRHRKHVRISIRAEEECRHHAPGYAWIGEDPLQRRNTRA